MYGRGEDELSVVPIADTLEHWESSFSIPLSLSSGEASLS